MSTKSSVGLKICFTSLKYKCYASLSSQLLWVVFWSCLLSTIVKGQQTFSFVQRFWNNENGLPQNTVYDLVQDRIGYIWVATEEGVCRFDGHNFTPMSPSTSDPLSSASFSDLALAPGGVWAISSRRALYISSAGDTVQNYFAHQLADGEQLSSITTDRLGRPWVGSTTGKLYGVVNGKLLPYKLNGIAQLSGARLQVLQATTIGLYIGSSKGLFLVPTGSSKVVSVPGLPSVQVRALAIEKKERIWVGTQDDGLWSLGDTIRQFSSKEGLMEPHIYSLATDSIGNLLIGTRGSGVQIAYNGRIRQHVSTTVLTDPVRALLTTNSGQVWVGTTGRGLLQLRQALVRSAPEALGLSGQIILPVYEHTNGELWTGIAGKGVRRFSKGKSTLITVADGLPSNTVLSIYGKGDFIYIGTATGLSRFRISTGVIDKNLGQNEGLEHPTVQAVLVDAIGRVWIACRGGGLYRIGASGKIQRLPLPNIGNADLICLYEDRQGHIWVGTTGSGMVEVSSSDYIKYFGTRQGLPAETVECFFEDAAGTLWVGTDKGLVCALPKGFRLFDKSRGLYFNDIYRLLPDKEGNVWMSGNFGLQRISGTELQRIKNIQNTEPITVRHFSTQDGMANAEANGGIFPAGWRLRDGTLWFPTVDGVAVVDPARVNGIQDPINVNIQKIRYGNVATSPGIHNRIPPGVFNIEIDYTSIDFDKPQDIYFYYRLKELDTTWIKSENRRTAYFSGLAHGNYTFEVRAEKYGVCSSIAQSHFVVLPFFYQTWWFRIIIVLVLLAIGIGIFIFQRKIGNIRLREQQQILNAQISGQELERQHIGAELHDNINQQLTTVKLYLDVARSDERNRMELIEKSELVVNRAIHEIRDLSKSLVPPSLKDIGLEEALQELAASVCIVAKPVINIEIAGPIECLSAELKLTAYRIIQEQLNNVVKYATAENVWIHVDAGADQLLLEVHDNGIGFNSKIRSKGIGFLNIRNRLEPYGGRMVLDSSLGKGCRLQVTIPLRKGERVLA